MHYLFYYLVMCHIGIFVMIIMTILFTIMMTPEILSGMFLSIRIFYDDIGSWYYSWPGYVKN